MSSGGTDKRLRSKYSQCVAFDPSGKRLAFGGNWGIEVWDTDKASRLYTLETFPEETQAIECDPIVAVAFSGTEDRLLSVDKRGTLVLWDIKARKTLAVGKNPDCPAPRVDFHRAADGSIQSVLLGGSKKGGNRGYLKVFSVDY